MVLSLETASVHEIRLLNSVSLHRGEAEKIDILFFGRFPRLLRRIFLVIYRQYETNAIFIVFEHSSFMLYTTRLQKVLN